MSDYFGLIDSNVPDYKRNSRGHFKVFKNGNNEWEVSFGCKIINAVVLATPRCFNNTRQPCYSIQVENVNSHTLRFKICSDCKENDIDKNVGFSFSLYLDRCHNCLDPDKKIPG